MRIRAEQVPAYPAEVLAQRLGALPKQPQPDTSANRLTRGWRLRSMLAASALAAATMLVALWPFSVDHKEALAFGDVQKAVDATQTMQYRILHYSNDPNYLAQYNLKAGEPNVSQLFYAGNRVRGEQPLGMLSITDFDRGLAMFVQHRQRRAEMFPIPDVELRKKSLTFQTKLRNLAQSDAKKLPDRQMNGRTVSEFAIQIDDQNFTVTVDPQTKLPIRMEVVQRERVERGQGEIREVYTDFVFDAPIDDSLFRLDPPAGYEVVNRVPRNSTPNPSENMELVVSGEDGIGPVKFGTKPAEIVRLFGEPDWREDKKDVHVVSAPGDAPRAEDHQRIRTTLGYDRRGFRLTADDRRGLHSIHCFNRHGGGLSTVHGFQGKTKEGIALDASLEEVLKTYGKPDAQQEARQVFYRKRGYQFLFYDKKLASIHVNRPAPAIETEIEVRGDQIIERVKDKE